MIDAIERDWFWSAYPHMGEIKRYKVVPMTDEDIAKEKVDELEAQLAQRKRLAEEYAKRTAEIDAELQKQKKRLKP